MNRYVRHLTTLFVTALLFGACGDDTATTTASGGAGGTTALPEPIKHRVDGEMCSGTPPAGNAIGQPGSDCMTDSDCVAGDNGRCIWPFGGDDVCRYDECSQDSDCGSVGICSCRLKSAFGVNVCHQGNCVVDGDCGVAGYCSPSALLFPNCMMGISPGSVGYFCHTPQDGCTDDEDCGESSTCLFKVESMRWSCQALLCTN